MEDRGFQAMHDRRGCDEKPNVAGNFSIVRLRTETSARRLASVRVR
jgi:hypothetical protein